MVKTKIEAIADNLMTIQPLLYKSLSKPCKSKSSITTAGIFVLGILKRNGVLSMSDIGNKLSMPKPHMTVIIDKLIEEEAVERLHDQDDRRIINIKITEKGAALYEEINQLIALNLKENLISLDEKQQELLLESSGNVKDLLIQILVKKNN